MEIIAWIMAAASITGVVLNIKKDRRCFLIWAVTNGGWCLYDFSIGAIAQAALFLVYFCLAIWGIYSWKTEKPGQSRAEDRSIKRSAGEI